MAKGEEVVVVAEGAAVEVGCNFQNRSSSERQIGRDPIGLEARYLRMDIINSCTLTRQEDEVA